MLKSNYKKFTIILLSICISFFFQSSTSAANLSQSQQEEEIKHQKIMLDYMNFCLNSFDILSKIQKHKMDNPEAVIDSQLINNLHILKEKILSITTTKKVAPETTQNRKIIYLKMYLQLDNLAYQEIDLCDALIEYITSPTKDNLLKYASLILKIQATLQNISQLNQDLARA